MVNAMKILDDHDIIYEVFQGNFLNFHKSDDKIAIFLKKYINQAVAKALKHHDDYQVIYDQLWKEYEIRYQKWIKHGMNGPSPIYTSNHFIGDSMDYIRLKVNHYRQKFWYWKKLKR